MLKYSLLLALLSAASTGMDLADIVRARDLGYHQHYDSALAVTSAEIARDPSDPAALFWHASIVQILLLDSGDKRIADSFHVLTNDAVAKARIRLHQNPNDAEAHFYLGMALFNRATMLGWQQRVLAAFFLLFEVSPHLNAAMARDSSLCDARLGLGGIEFVRASANRYLPGLGLFGSRRKAYKFVSAVAGGDGPFWPAAKFLLAFMLKEDGDYAAAILHCRELLELYPGNRTAMRLMRDAQYRSGMFSDALATGRQVEQKVLQAFPGNRYALSENWIVCGMAFAGLGQVDSARDRFNRVVAWEQYAREVPWLPVYVRDAKRWLRRHRS